MRIDMFLYEKMYQKYVISAYVCIYENVSPAPKLLQRIFIGTFLDNFMFYLKILAICGLIGEKGTSDQELFFHFDINNNILV